MTKFEEEFKALTSWEWVNVDLIQQILTKFGNWHSDEEFQIVEEIGGSFALANKNLIDANTKLAEEIANLKSQLQQKALPVVPEDVDKAIKYLKKHNNSTLSDLDDILTAKGFSWLNDFQFKDRRFGVGGLNNKLFILSHLAVTGYQVEKPQLFYLKHIDMSETNEHYDYYLSKNPKGNIGHSGIGKGKLPKLKCILKLTQEEIDSMQTGSYELVPVEDGE